MKIKQGSNVHLWNCPQCGWENEDVPNWTAVPLCANCDAEVDWADLVEHIQCRNTGLTWMYYRSPRR